MWFSNSAFLAKVSIRLTASPSSAGSFSDRLSAAKMSSKRPASCDPYSPVPWSRTFSAMSTTWRMAVAEDSAWDKLSAPARARETSLSSASCPYPSRISGRVTPVSISAPSARTKWKPAFDKVFFRASIMTSSNKASSIMASSSGLLALGSWFAEMIPQRISSSSQVISRPPGQRICRSLSATAFASPMEGTWTIKPSW